MFALKTFAIVVASMWGFLWLLSTMISRMTGLPF
jgi:hypothetical protein